jgi:hypothetical protein
MRRLFVVAALSTLVASCAFDPQPKDGKLPCDSGCPSGYLCGVDNYCWRTNAPAAGSGQTMGGICNETGAAFCQSAVRCLPGTTTQSQCVAAYVGGCCQNNGTCANSIPTLAASVYAQCKSDLATMSCTDVSSQNLPSSCASI